MVRLDSNRSTIWRRMTTPLKYRDFALWDRTNRPLWLRCTAGVFLPVIAALVRVEFLGILQNHVTYLTFYPAVAIAAIFGGFGVGLLATVVSALLADYFWMEPIHQLFIANFADRISIAVFVASCTLISYLAEATYRAQVRAKDAEAQVTLASERERAALTIQESEERLRVMANSIPQLAWIAGADGYLYWYNQRWYEYTGTTPEQMEGWGWQRVHDPDALPGVLARWKESIATGKPFDMTFPLRGADGNFRQFLTRVQPVRNADGQVIQWCGTNTDVTEHMLMEDELRKSRDELERRVQERTARLEEVNITLAEQADLLNLAHDAILVREVNDTIAFWSSGAVETYGFTAQQALDRVSHELLKTQFPEPLDLIIDRVIREGRWEGELLQTTAAGEQIAVESRWALKLDKNGNPSGFLEINRNVTFRKRAEEALKSNMARLELINSELQEFAFVASHDLQEPLRKIQTFCDLAIKRCSSPLDPVSRDYLDRVMNSAARMRQLLEGLLQFSRVATRQEPFRKLDIGKIAREAAGVFEQQIRETTAIIEIDKLPGMEVDATQMLRLFQNLIGNALKFRGELSPVIKVYARCDGQDSCDIFVEDNGIGFDMQYAERIFKPFQRLHGRKEYEGTGMGLAICRKIAERHGGNIRAESEPGKGSRFIVRLPLKQEDPGDA